MNWRKWKPKYKSITEKLGIDESKDRRSARILDDLLTDFDISPLKEILDCSRCVVFGAGPSLEEDLRNLDKRSGLENVLITADGATSAVNEYKYPEIIVTDLDGKVDEQLEAWEEGSWLVVHAHGDNIDKIRKYVPDMKDRIIGTIQVDKPARLANFGGFTDGDRAAFMAYELGASKIYLAGMDLGGKIGEYTGDTNKDEKIIKLKICKNLLSWLSNEFDAPVVNITAEGVDIPGVPRKDYPTS